jgi:hypothetical protein
VKENHTLLQGWRPYGVRVQNCTGKNLLGTWHSFLFLYELPLLPNKIAIETSLHKPGAVRSVDWIFIGALAWR